MTPDATSVLLQHLLVSLVLPVWLLAGLADWGLHRWMRIEHTAGAKESALHLAMLIELGAGAVVAAACVPTAGFFAWLLAMCVLHEATLVIDLAYAARRRVIPVAEQWVHAVQQAMPWVSLALLAVAHRDVLMPLASDAHGPADWRLMLRQEPLPAEVWALLAGGGALLSIAYIAEWARALAARPGPSIPTSKGHS